MKYTYQSKDVRDASFSELQKIVQAIFDLYSTYVESDSALVVTIPIITERSNNVDLPPWKKLGNLVMKNNELSFVKYEK